MSRIRFRPNSSNAASYWKSVKRSQLLKPAMKVILILALLLSGAQAAQGPNRAWRPATYRGLTVGKSKRTDLLRVFGQPRWSRSPKREDEDERDRDREVWSNFESVGEFPGPTNVLTDKRGVIARIDSYPSALTRDQAIAHFGKAYVLTRYDLDSCLGDEDSEVFFESPKGSFLYLEYRARGIAISIGYKDLVTKISYLKGPVGSPKSKCH